MLSLETSEKKKMDKEAVLKRILEEEDYIRCPKFSNSLKKFLATNSDGVDNSTIARLLMISEEEVEKLYSQAVQELREEMAEKDAD